MRSTSLSRATGGRRLPRLPEAGRAICVTDKSDWIRVVIAHVSFVPIAFFLTIVLTSCLDWRRGLRNTVCRRQCLKCSEQRKRGLGNGGAMCGQELLTMGTGRMGEPCPMRLTTPTGTLQFAASHLIFSESFSPAIERCDVPSPSSLQRSPTACQRIVAEFSH